LQLGFIFQVHHHFHYFRLMAPDQLLSDSFKTRPSPNILDMSASEEQMPPIFSNSAAHHTSVINFDTPSIQI
jgi:hypothetical protein